MMAPDSSYPNGTTANTAIRQVSDLKDPNKRIWIVTTAALPWMTGTAVNPLMRALYITRGRPKGYVTLVIPWLKNDVQRKSLYGKNKFPSQRVDQEEMIRTFCRDRAHCTEEEQKLNIMFYDAEYQTTFGSIFPSVDICSLIPTEEADVAILEEPEHLNWFRVPAAASLETTITTTTTVGSRTGTLATVPEKEDYVVSSIDNNDSNYGNENANGSLQPLDHNNHYYDTIDLGWAFKFRHVVGILHTNYEAYVQQYGMAAKHVTAPALHALSSLVVRAHCHKIIRLSATLPSLAAYKEVTCNVHGVRSKFLDRDQEDGKEEKPPACVYFIGKVIWAKGFERVLELQNSYRAKHGNYFEMDVYGSGPDQKVIERAFLGRSANSQSSNQRQESANGHAPTLPSPEPIERNSSSEVFDLSTSLRQHITSENSSSSLDGWQSTSIRTTGNNDVEPLQVLGDLSKQGLTTGKDVTMAAISVAKTAVKKSLHMTFTKVAKEEAAEEGDDNGQNRYYYSFDPPKSIHEFRRNPIPARFLGVRDHAELAKIPSYKVFLNMSTSEVLCTTSAEAIAMGKFLIIPKHPSNTFFLQFPNCLSYTTLEECLAMLEFAIENEPKPLSDEHMEVLSWDGAMERLFESAAITEQDWNHWRDNGLLKRDEDAARFHAETAKKGQQITSFLRF